LRYNMLLRRVLQSHSVWQFSSSFGDVYVYVAFILRLGLVDITGAGRSVLS